MADSAIEWTDAVWNPTTGCDQVSPGCDHCYALTMAKRLKGMGQAKYQNDGDPRTSGPGFGLTMHPDALEVPLSWRKPRKVFVNSMSDLFHAHVSPEFIARVWDTMEATPQHTYQILTKRPIRMRRWIKANRPYPLPNVWLGTSVEDQQRADERIPELLDTPAAVRFLSCEPLLGPVRMRAAMGVEGMYGILSGRKPQGLHWVIVGGESGPGARPMDVEWVRTLLDQCQQAGVAPFVKQLGSVWAREHGADPKGGKWEHWPADLRVRDMPEVVSHA